MKKPDKLPPLSEAQTEIMVSIWEHGEATLGDVWRDLAAKREVARNTVQTLLSRLVEKGWLEYRAEGKVFHYRAAAPKASAMKAAARRLVDVAFEGSTEGLMMALLDGHELSKEEADRIRKLIELAETRAEEGREGR